MAGEPRRGDEDWNWQTRQETPEQRLDRNFGELLQELRVAQTDVQILFAFLLTLAFTQCGRAACWRWAGWCCSCSAVLLIADVVLGRLPAVVLTAGVVCWYVAFWYAVPLWSHRGGMG
jgi:hypothetical protein